MTGPRPVDGRRARGPLLTVVLAAAALLLGAGLRPLDSAATDRRDLAGPGRAQPTARGAGGTDGDPASPEEQGSGSDSVDERRDTDVLAIASVSPWVEPDGEFQVRFEPTTGVPADAELTVTVHQSIPADEDLREVVTGILDGDAPGRILQRPRTRPLADLGDPAAGLVLTIPIRSKRADSDRVLLPNPGIHPVHLLVTEPGGPELWSEVVFLNRLPVRDDDADPTKPVRVTLLLPVESGPAIGAGSDGFTLEERARLGATTALLQEASDLPLTLAPVPNTLDGLALSDEPWAAELLEAVGDQEAPRSLLARPYTHVDTAGLVGAGASEELGRQIDLGRQTVERVGGRPATTDTWALDDTVTPAVLPVLQRAGIHSVVLPTSALDLPDDLSEDEAAARPVRLQGGGDVRALAVDEAVSDRLATSRAEPGAAAHEVVTLLMATWFEHATAEHPAASVVRVGEGTDPAVLRALTPSLTTRSGPLVADLQRAPVPGFDEDDDVPVVPLAGRAPSDLRGAVQAVDGTRRLTEAYRSMVGDRDPNLWAWERTNDQSLSTAADDGRRLQMHYFVRSAVQGRIARIEPPPARRVVVTSHETTIPLRFRNGLDFDVELVLRTRSPRLDFEQGRSRTIVLRPGENRVDLPVTVRAPGESLLRVELSSPVPGIDLDVPDVPVRSTAISGVGAALSIVSVLFLVAWWVQSHRRRRRDGAKLAGVHPSGAGGADSLPAGG